MKKALAYALSLVLLLSLTACNKPQTEQPDTSQPEPEATTNQTEPETEQPTVTAQIQETAQVTAIQLSQTEQGQPQKEVLQGDELIAVFQHTYDDCQKAPVLEENQIKYEVDSIEFHFTCCFSTDKALPTDYAEQYIEWRSVKESPATSEGTSSNQTSTPTETVQSPSVSDSSAQATQAQGGETPASGENPSDEVDLSTQRTEHDPSTFTDFGNLKPDQINSFDPESGLWSAGHFGIGVHVG